MSEEVKELLSAFAEWMPFVQGLQRQPESVWLSSLQPGKWTLKDMVCHIMLWDKYFYDEAISKITLGKPVTLLHTDFNEFNKQAIIYASTISIDELVKETHMIRTRIISAIESMPEKITIQTFIDGEGNPFQVIPYLKDFIWHDQHHMIPAKQWLEQNV